MAFFTLADLAKRTESRLVGDLRVPISGIDTLEGATPEDASFLSNPRYRDAIITSKAGVICVSPDTPLLEGRNYLISSDPSRAFQHIAELFIPKGRSGFIGIHPTAVIHETATIGANVSIGPYAVIDRDVTIGSGTQLGPHVSIGYESTIGMDCILHASSTVRERCHLKDRVILQPGAVIGSCGFGFIPDPMGRYQKL